MLRAASGARWAAAVGVTLAALAGAGCGFGPRALERTHGQYAEAVRRVDEEQLLRALLQMRYRETPVGLDVTSIATQYEVSASAEARPFFEAPNPASGAVFRTFTRVLPDLTVAGANRPTITMLPRDDGSSVRRFLTPITGDTLVFLGRTGWPISTIFRLWIDRVNAVPNAPGAPHLRLLAEYQRFNRVTELFQSLQERGLLSIVTEERLSVVGGPFPANAVTAAAAVEAEAKGLQFRPRDEGRSWDLVRPERRLVMKAQADALGDAEVSEVYSLLNLQPGRTHFDLVITTEPPSSRPDAPYTELRLRPRSTAQVYLYLGYGVEMPSEHLSCGVAQLPTSPDGAPFDGREVTRGLFTVHCCAGKRPPPEAYVAVRYRGHWFYIDDRDADSKTTFSLVLQLSSLDFARQQLGSVPALTLPVGR